MWVALVSLLGSYNEMYMANFNVGKGRMRTFFNAFTESTCTWPVWERKPLNSHFQIEDYDYDPLP